MRPYTVMKLRLLFFCLLLVSTPVFAVTRIAGQVLNDTTGKPAAGANLELVRALNGSTPSLAARTKTDVAGKFAASLNLTKNDLVFVRCNWGGHIYVAPAYDGGGKLSAMGMKLSPQNLKLRVFDTTTHLVPLSFLVHHLAIKSEKGGIQCVERIVVENPTKKLFLGIGKRRATILLNLPAAAQNVKLDPEITDAKLEKRPDGWAIIKPIAPNVGNAAERNLVIINYDMKWPSSLPWQRELDFSRKIQYPTKFFFVARENEDKKLKIIAPKLSADQQAPLNVKGQPQTRWVNAAGRPMGGNPVLQAGDELSLKISSPVEPVFWGFLAFVVLLLLAVPTLLLARTKVGGNADTFMNKIEEPVGATSVSMQPSILENLPRFDSGTQEIIERIARLDEQYARGEVEAQEYQTRRSAWKNEVLAHTMEQLLQSPHAASAHAASSQPTQQSHEGLSRPE